MAKNHRRALAKLQMRQKQYDATSREYKSAHEKRPGSMNRRKGA